MYNIRITKDRINIIKDADKDGDMCPVDAICDSIPDIVKYVKSLEDIISEYKTNNQKLHADVNFYKNKLNNVRSQKARRLIKKGKQNDR